MIACLPARGLAWDAATHRMITRLAVAALPPGPLHNALAVNLNRIEYFSIEPDLLRERGDKAEGHRHFIDLEYFGSDPIAALDPNYAVMVNRFGTRRLRKAGVLPWAIEQEADLMATGLRDRDCASMLQAAGFLSHYVGDASQPLHTTEHYDGYSEDRGVHARLERTADLNVAELQRSAAPRIRLEKIASVWTPVIAELRQSNALIPELITADRQARSQAGSSWQLSQILMREDQQWITNQVADAASTAASIWQFEWERAGKPPVCIANQ
ncbi:MAG: zinc dependent phospholipase C family protein [Candidatus Binataceae bacterium]|nr:zinc dependent phospholipase C family protein [Candidatus Binataceae bacterium]